MPSGYSPNPLAKKLGIKENFSLLTVDAPDDYRELVDPLPPGVSIADSAGRDFDLIHVFTNRRDDLLRNLSESRALIKQNGAIWISWYKKAAKLPTEITEDTIRDAALAFGLVDVKVCAVDDKWSGLKLVIRRENRT